PRPPLPQKDGLLQLWEMPIWYWASGPYALAAGAERATTATASMPGTGAMDSIFSLVIAPSFGGGISRHRARAGPHARGAQGGDGAKSQSTGEGGRSPTTTFATAPSVTAGAC